MAYNSFHRRMSQMKNVHINKRINKHSWADRKTGPNAGRTGRLENGMGMADVLACIELDDVWCECEPFSSSQKFGQLNFLPLGKYYSNGEFNMNVNGWAKTLGNIKRITASQQYIQTHTNTYILMVVATDPVSAHPIRFVRKQCGTVDQIILCDSVFLFVVFILIFYVPIFGHFNGP